MISHRPHCQPQPCSLGFHFVLRNWVDSQLPTSFSAASPVPPAVRVVDHEDLSCRVSGSRHPLVAACQITREPREQRSLERGASVSH